VGVKHMGNLCRRLHNLYATKTTEKKKGGEHWCRGRNKTKGNMRSQILATRSQKKQQHPPKPKAAKKYRRNWGENRVSKREKNGVKP